MDLVHLESERPRACNAIQLHFRNVPSKYDLRPTCGFLPRSCGAEEVLKVISPSSRQWIDLGELIEKVLGIVMLYRSSTLSVTATWRDGDLLIYGQDLGPGTPTGDEWPTLGKIWAEHAGSGEG